MSARLLVAARVYAFNYLQDEAEEVECCTCGPKQHAEAKELFAAIKEAEAAPLPAEQPSNPVPSMGGNTIELTDDQVIEIAQDMAISRHSDRDDILMFAEALHRARIVGQQTKGGGNG